MPNRILKESICTSDSIDSLSEFQEIFFYRLITACDDYGRMDARPRILAARLFPLRNITPDRVEAALSALADEDLITLYTVSGKPYLQMRTWDKHQQVRAKKSKYPSPDDINDSDNANFCNQMISDDYKCPRNPIQSESESISESESESELMTAEDAQKFQHDHDKVIEAAQNAGFHCSPTVNSMLIALYADYGLEKVLDAINECATHSATSIAYLRAVLKGGPKKAKAYVSAQDFTQRDYSEVPEEMNKALDREVLDFLAKENDI